MGNREKFLSICCKIIQLGRHPALIHLAVRAFNEAKIVHAPERRQRGDESNIWTFRRFHRTDASVVTGVHVTHLEARPLTRQTTRTQCG